MPSKRETIGNPPDFNRVFLRSTLFIWSARVKKTKKGDPGYVPLTFFTAKAVRAEDRAAFAFYMD